MTTQQIIKNTAMKTNKFFILLSTLALMLVVTACVQDDDFQTPEVNIQEPDITALGEMATFNSVIARYETAVSNGDQVGVYNEFDTPQYIVGYVVSSDRSGNFFEELIIQNTPDAGDAGSDPRRGLNILINVRSLSDTYEVGRKVYVKLNGLAIGIQNGVYTLGKASGSQLVQLQEYEYLNYVIRSAEVVTIAPKVVAIEDLTEQDENTFIQIDDVQINRGQLSLTYAGESSDEFDGFRTIESCASTSTLTLQTSTFADFKQLPVPQNRGSISGIFSRDFGDDFNVLVLNSIADVNFENPERCDPEVLDCQGPFGGNTILFEEDFEGLSNLSQLETAGWEHFNIAGSVNFVIGSFSGNEYAQISGFNSGDSEIETWLVTPAINLDSTTGEYLNFDLEVAYANGIILSVLITDAYTGDVTTTEWTEIDVNIPNTPSSGFGGFNNSGDINISCLDGDVRVAFKYLGSDPSATTRYHINNVEVAGN